MSRIPPHWRRAPLVLLHHRPVLFAVAFGAFLVALASASAPFFSAAAGSAALKEKLHEVTPLAAGLEIEYQYPGAGYQTSTRRSGLRTAQLDRRFRRQVRDIPLIGAPVVSTLPGTFQVSRAGDDSATDNVALMARTGALDHVIRLAGDPHADGIWISDTVAKTLHLAPGGRLELQVTDANGGAKVVTFPVAGVYEALWRRPLTPSWINFSRFIYPQTGLVQADPVLPPTLAFISQKRMDGLFAKLDPGGVAQYWEFPFTARSPLLSEAKRVERQFAAVKSSLRGQRGLTYAAGTTGYTALPTAVGLADKTIAGVAPPTRLLAEAGALIALVIVGASGVFLVARRRAEARTLFARGEAVSSFAARTSVEALLPTLVGALLGLAVALGLIRLVEPHGTVETSTLLQGAFVAGGGVAIGLVLIGASAGIAYARLYEVGRRTHPVLRRAPWELLALVAGVVLLVRLHRGSGLTRDEATGIAHPSLASFLVPLLLVGGAATLVMRAGTAPLGRAAARAWRRPLAVALALRRLAAGRGVLALLVVTCAVALGLLIYAQTLVSSLEESVRQKAFIAAGSDAQGIVDASQPVPRHFPFPVTRVELGYGAGRNGSADGDAIDVEAIDPRTFAAAVHWNRAWGPALGPLLERLDEPGAVHVIAAGPRVPLRSITIGDAHFAVDATWVRAFPGMTANGPLVVVSRRVLERAGGGMDPLDPEWANLWAKGPTGPVVKALETEPANAFYTATAAGFRSDPNVALAVRTFAFMRALGIAAGALALFCLVLYLVARQRAQTIATAFGRRMGLRRTTAAASLALELAAVLLVAAGIAVAGALVAAGNVVGRSDLLPGLPPGPTFVTPWLGILLVLVALACATLVGGAVASRRPRDEAVVEAIRLE